MYLISLNVWFACSAGSTVKFYYRNLFNIPYSRKLSQGFKFGNLRILRLNANIRTTNINFSDCIIHLQ